MINVPKSKLHSLSRIVADVTGDGHLQLDNKRGVISFYSKKLNTIKNEDKRFFDLFEIKGHVYKNRRGFGGRLTYGIFFTSKDIATYLAGKGVPAGNKTSTIFYVPNWILDGAEKIKKEYLKGIFTSEGSIYCTKSKNKKRWRIEIEQYKNLRIKNYGKMYMEQIKNMLENFGIKCSPVRFGKKSKRSDNSFTIATKIDIEKKYFKRFNAEIGFDDKKKNKKLLKVIAGDMRG